jgi:hypothetical protein
MADAALVHVHAPSKLQLAWETHYVGHVRAVNVVPIDNYLLKCARCSLSRAPRAAAFFAAGLAAAVHVHRRVEHCRPARL